MTELVVDDVVVVDWSAAASPKLGRDSIWIAHVARSARSEVRSVENFATRALAIDWLLECFAEAARTGRHLVCGLDFSFGYPHGYAELLARAFEDISCGDRPFEQVLSVTEQLIVDDLDNANNRFTVAEHINERTGVALFWGHPRGRTYRALAATKAVPEHLQPNHLADFRLTEASLSVSSNWQLLGIGAVGSQVLTGLRALAHLRSSPTQPRCWPFEPHNLEQGGGAIVLAEVWPTLLASPIEGVAIKDAWQVESVALDLARRSDVEWGQLLNPPCWATLTQQQRDHIFNEEGWILGIM